MRVDSKITILAYAMGSCFLILALTLTRMQIFEGEKYRELALNNRIRRVTVSAPRGIVYDRNGKILVGNRPSYDIELVKDEIEDLEGIAKDLAQTLDVSASEILHRVKSGRYVPYLPVIVARDVGIEKLTRLVETRGDLRGINIAARAVRNYPHGSAAAHVLGSLGQISPSEYERWKPYGYGPQDVIGKTGIEFVFNADLVGRAGGMQVQVDSRGNKDKVLGYKVPVHGKDLKLTLDLELQKIVEEQLVGKRGAIVALEVGSGEVLALASAPSFNPALFVESTKRGARDALLRDQERPLVNRAISGLYPAGSVFKAIVGLAALQTGAINPETRFYCGGFLKIGDRDFHCWRKNGHGTINLKEALKYSCNVFFYQAGLQAGRKGLEKVAGNFGLGHLTGFALPYEASGLLPTPRWKKKRGLGSWTTGDTVNLSIGQGYLLVTPLQLAILGASLADGHMVPVPRIVREMPEGDRSGARGPLEEQLLRGREISLDAERMELVRQGMMHAVNDRDGTGHEAHLDTVLIAGKTGTAQTSSNRKDKKDHAWFMGFAPFKNPRIALAVILEEAGSGGVAAAPVAREIFKAYFDQVATP